MLLLAGLLVPASAGAQRVLVVFHPGTGASTVFDALTAREQLSVGLMGATQGPYSVRQTLLDLGQGARVSRSGYEPAALPMLSLRIDGTSGVIPDWRTAARRAATAPGDLRPGLLAGSVPGGAGYVGVGRPGASQVEAVLAADRAGRVAEVSLGSESDVAERVRVMLASRRLVVAALPVTAGADRQLDAILAGRRPDELVLVVRTPPRSRAHQLLPLGAAGLGCGAGQRAPCGRSGLLTSRTTRRGGLVAGIDLLPTVLEHLGVAVPRGVTGRPVTVRGERDVAALRRLERRLRVVYPRRYPSLLAFGLVLAAGVALLWVLGRRAAAARVGALAVFWLPLVTLLTAALAPERRIEVALVALLPWALAALTDRLVPWPRAPAVPALGAVVAYAVDLGFGSHLIVRSLLGPNPRFGARFYGIGNELEAILPGLLLVGLAAAAGTAVRSVRLAALVGGASLGLGGFVGAGRLGADVGGVITIGAAGAAAVLLCLPGRLTRRRLALATLVPAAALAALAAVDLLTRGDSHFTSTVLQAEDGQALGEVAERRLTLAWNALWRGLMPLATLLALVVAAWGIRRRERLLSPVADRPAWPAAFAGALAGGLIGAVANDSGPVLFVLAVVVLAAAGAYLTGTPARTGTEPFLAAPERNGGGSPG